MGIKRTCLCGLMLLAGCSKPTTDIPAFGTLERDRIDLSADSNEPIRVILVREGQRVAAGESLLTQSSERAEVALARARAEEAVARSSLAEAESGPRAQEIVQGRARLEAARSARLTAKYELDRQVSLMERKYASASQVDTLRGRYEEAQAREAEAEAALDELLAGTRSEAIDQARNHHAATSATVRDLQLTVSRTIIHSPIAGIVETLPYKVGERPPACRGYGGQGTGSDQPVCRRAHSGACPNPCQQRNSGSHPRGRIPGSVRRNGALGIGRSLLYPLFRSEPSRQVPVELRRRN